MSVNFGVCESGCVGIAVFGSLGLVVCGGCIVWGLQCVSIADVLAYVVVRDLV